jgi:hypothetical protein
MRRSSRTLIGVAAALVVAAGSIGVAGAHEGRGHALGPIVHVDATFAYLDGTTKALVGDRGSITAVDADSLTLVRADGVEVMVGITAETCIKVDGQVATWEDLVVGARATTISQADAAGGLAALVIRSGIPFARPDDPSCGLFEGAYHADGVVTFKDGTTAEFAWDKGRISGLGPHRIRIERLDGASVAAAVDRLTHVCGARSYRHLKLGQLVWIVSEKVTGDPAQEPLLLARVIHVVRG